MAKKRSITKKKRERASINNKLIIMDMKGNRIRSGKMKTCVIIKTESIGC